MHVAHGFSGVVLTAAVRAAFGGAQARHVAVPSRGALDLCRDHGGRWAVMPQGTPTTAPGLVQTHRDGDHVQRAGQFDHRVPRPRDVSGSTGVRDRAVRAGGAVGRFNGSGGAVMAFRATAGTTH